MCIRDSPYAPLQIDPAAKVLHYAQEIFEGLKAYRTDDGSIQLFRPMDNIRRMNGSAAVSYTHLTPAATGVPRSGSRRAGSWR